MIIAVFMLAVGATIGWHRAARRGGSTADKLQYAAAHGLPAFLVGMIVMTIVARLGLLG